MKSNESQTNMIEKHLAADHGPVVRFEGVNMVFTPRFKAPVHALRGMNMEVTEGSIVGLLGPNGCGKTTAISCLLGLLHPQSGQVLVWGRSVSGETPVGAKNRVGVLLEDTKLPPFLHVGKVLEMVCRIKGYRGKRLTLEMSRVIELTGIGNLLSRRVAVLSKGQARRVGLGVAMVGDPPLLVLDEPSAGLDVSAREEFNELLRGLKSHERTIIIASHLLSDIESTCSHIAIMRKGRIILYEDSWDLLKRAREKKDEKDIMIDRKFVDVLHKLGIQFGPSKYPGLVLLSTDGPEHELMLKLATSGIVPSRIEPKVNLVSLYMDITKGGEEDEDLPDTDLPVS